jgi:hypothetical protein
MRRLDVHVLIALLMPFAAASAQRSVAPCDSTLTIDQCFDHYLAGGTKLTPNSPASASDAQHAVNLAAQQASATTANVTARRATGATPGSNVSAIRDFLPRAAAAFLRPGLSDDPSALGIALNFPARSQPLSAQLEVAVTKPTLYQPLLDAVPPISLDAATSTLSDRLNDLDDIKSTLSFNVESRRFGRRYRQHADAFSQLASEILGPLEQDISDRGLALAVALKGLSAQIEPSRTSAPACRAGTMPNADIRSVPLSCLAPAQRTLIVSRIQAVATASDVLTRESPRLLENSGFNLLGDLVNNQPQINGELFVHRRREIVGPNEIGGEIRFEVGRHNLNALRGSCGGNAITAPCLQQFSQQNSVRRGIARQPRFWGSAEFSVQPSYHVALPQYATELRLDRAWKLAPKVGYGMYLGTNTAEPDRARVDAKAEYTFNQDASGRLNRLIATLAWTGKLSDQGATVITVVYANKPEFLGQVNRHLSANVGLSYKLVDATK